MLALILQAPKPVAEIPCRVVQNLVLLDVRLNARPAVALLDSGADATYVDAGAARAAGATEGSPVTTTGAGVGTQSGWEAKGLTLSLGGIKRTVARAFALRFPIPGGPRVEAVVGHELFAEYVVEIDYSGHRVRLYDPKTYRPATGAKTVPITLERNVPFASMGLALPGATAKPIRILVDTGVNVGLYLTGSFAARERLTQQYPDAPSSPDGTGIGGGTKARLLRGIKLDFGGASLATDAWFDVSSGGETGVGARFDGLLGGGVLSQYVVAFDEPHGRLVLRKEGA